MVLSEADIAYYKRGEYENSTYWTRMGGKPSFKGASVLDVGCGLGSLCVDVALSGAEKVVGLDTESRLIDFANENVRQNHPELIGKLVFQDLDLKDYDAMKFDYIISKDSFEHIMDLKGMLIEMKKHLKPRGQIYAGFGPLYNSPLGHHRRIMTFLRWRAFPWGHLFEKESTIMARMNLFRAQGGNVFTYKNGELHSIRDLGLNMLSLAEYRSAFQASGLKMVRFKVNQSKNLLSRIFFWMHVFPPLEEYLTHNIYCIMENTDR
jgi:cyclopropane fatty-acyl-phospholipid synthase-like methyltransferase